MGLLLIGCSQNDEIIRQNPENVVSKAATASGYYISPTSMYLAPYRDSMEVYIYDSEGWLANVSWTTDSRHLYDASVASSGTRYSFAIYSTGAHPSGKVNVLVNGVSIGVVTVYTSGGGGGGDSTLLDSVSGVDLQ